MRMVRIWEYKYVPSSCDYHVSMCTIEKPRDLSFIVSNNSRFTLFCWRNQIRYLKAYEWSSQVAHHPDCSAWNINYRLFTTSVFKYCKISARQSSLLMESLRKSEVYTWLLPTVVTVYCTLRIRKCNKRIFVTYFSSTMPIGLDVYKFVFLSKYTKMLFEIIAVWRILLCYIRLYLSIII